MKDGSPIGAPADDRESQYSSLDKAELERLAIAAIREHRTLLAADEVVYEEWTRANDNPSTSGAVLKTLQDEYIARQKKSEAQQCELAEIIDALGYVPDVPIDGDLQ